MHMPIPTFVTIAPCSVVIATNSDIHVQSESFCPPLSLQDCLWACLCQSIEARSFNQSGSILQSLPQTPMSKGLKILSFQKIYPCYNYQCPSAHLPCLDMAKLSKLPCPDHIATITHTAYPQTHCSSAPTVLLIPTTLVAFSKIGLEAGVMC